MNAPLRGWPFSFRPRLRRCLQQPEQDGIPAPGIIALLPCQYTLPVDSGESGGLRPSILDSFMPACGFRFQVKQLTPVRPGHPLPKGVGHFPINPRGLGSKLNPRGPVNKLPNWTFCPTKYCTAQINYTPLCASPTGSATYI
jgi:hypothetical protein